MIEVRENVPSIWPLTKEDLAYLLSVVQRSPDGGDEAKVLQSITPTRKPGYWQLTPGNYVGRLGLPSGDWIDFHSRFEFPDVIRLIQLSVQGPRLVNRYPTPSKSGLLLADALASAYARVVGRLVGQGLSKGYRSERRTSPPHGGRLDVAFHLARFAGRTDVLVTQRRRLSVDVHVNQALAAALEVLHRIPLSARVNRDLARLRPAFARVSRPSVRAADVAAIQLKGEETRYREALLLAEVVLRSQDLLPSGNAVAGASILFFMPDVWERYVAQWVRTNSPEGRVEAPHPFRLTREGRFAEADVVVKVGDRVQALFDAKYKPPASALSSQDIYQMVTYCEALDLKEATLVYPGAFAQKTVTVKGTAIHARSLALDLSDVAPATSAVA